MKSLEEIFLSSLADAYDTELRIAETLPIILKRKMGNSPERSK